MKSGLLPETTLSSMDNKAIIARGDKLSKEALSVIEKIEKLTSGEEQEEKIKPRLRPILQVIKNTERPQGGELPIDGLSEDIQRIITEYSDVYQCSRDMITAAVITIAGSAVGKRLTIDSGKYKNYPCLWVCNIAPSGSNKSAPIRKLLQPIREADADSYSIYKQEVSEWKSAGMKGRKPVFRQHLISDSTPEARNQVLSLNPLGILLYRDEIKGFIDDIGRYNKSGEVSQLLSVFDSDSITVNRKTDEPLLIVQPFMSILGGVQPDVIASTFGSDLLMNNGFCQRWLFCFPDETQMPMYSEASITEESATWWDRYIKSLLTFEEILTLNLSGGAKGVYIDYYDRLQRKKENAGSYMAATYSKLQIHVLRWCAVVHLMNMRDGDTEVTAEEMEYSVRCMDYFESRAAKVYQILKESSVSPMSKGEQIARLYQSTKPDSMSAFARGLGVSQQYVSKLLKKYPEADGGGESEQELRNYN